MAAAGLGTAWSAGRPWWARAADLTEPRPSQFDALRALGRTTLRLPDSLPNPSLGPGTDTLPAVEHFVVLMLENHSYDNFLGMLGRGRDGGRAQRPRGDGFTLAPDGRPQATNPYPDGRLQRAFHMPTTCQLASRPSQEWQDSHVQYGSGRNDGFVISRSGPVAMGYWTAADLPFTYDLAAQFPIGDRWFSSVLGQTDPNRRYLIAATSAGMTDDIGTGPGNFVPDSSLPAPANGTIFDRLSSAGISWADYNASFPEGATMELYPTDDSGFAATNARPIDQFFSDAQAGTLPAFSLLDPDYTKQSQENPQNIVVGEAFLARVVEAVGRSPAWRKTLLLVTYDEHGGYYDHVPPPPALAPDAIAPMVQPGESTYDGFRRYGFRVPAVVVSPYAKRNYVSHVVYDHTSVLAFLERKWNLGALTYRDANANDITDFLDLNAMAKGEPTFPELPALAAAGDDASRLACSVTGPGAIPPPGSISAGRGRGGASGPRLEIRRARVSRRARGIVAEVATNRGSLRGVTLSLQRGTRVLARTPPRAFSSTPVSVVLRRHGSVPPPGRYEVVAREDGRVLARRTVLVPSATPSLTG